MNKTNMSQRLNARMHFKSLLLLSLLAGSASAQTPMPSVPFEMPVASQPLVYEGGAELPVDSSRSTWTIRQHASWLLGFKSRRPISSNSGGSSSTCDSVEPSVPEVPHLDVAASTAMLALPEVPAGTIALVEHTQALPPALESAQAQDTASVTTAGHTQAADAPIAHALAAAPPNLNLGPVVSGPVPPLPLEQLSGSSLMQVDVTGVDVSQLDKTPEPGGSLIDALGFQPPTGFSMRDSDAEPMGAGHSSPSFPKTEHDSSGALASPGRAKPVSIHEGFAPRSSSANQAARLTGGESQAIPAGDRMTTIVPGTSQFSMSDKSESSSGPVLNRFSDKEAVHEKLADRDMPLPSASGSAIAKSFTDKGSLLSFVPVEVSSDGGKTSRSAKPVELTPPARLTKDVPRPLPLMDTASVASTGINANLPSSSEKAASPSKPITFPEPTSPAATLADSKQVAKTPSADAPASEKAVEKSSPSLIEGFVPPTLLSGTAPKPLATAPIADTQAADTQAAKELKAKDAAGGPVETQSSSSSVVAKAVPAQPEPTQVGERVTLSDFNPIALKRPVIRAANVALPAPIETESMVIPSSHEVDDATQQAAAYAKLASKLQQAVRQKFPGLRVKISSNEEGLVVTGNVVNNVEAGKVLSFVRKASLCPVADRLTTSQ